MQTWFRQYIFNKVLVYTLRYGEMVIDQFDEYLFDNAS